MRERQARGADIFLRLRRWSAEIIRLVERLPKERWAQHVGLQTVRSATSAGANYQEARYAQSRADFVHKVSIAAKEVAETLYWLELIAELNLQPDALPSLLREADELTAILVSSGRTARANA
ncbi:MAG TPA: four helix bundle protein [Polyangiaceae bacterium]|nr:four helix bundle protein [Polyangiaceae bacterium]